MATNEKVRVRGLSIYRPIIYGNTARVLTPQERENAPPDHTHQWTVAVRSAASVPDSDSVGGADDMSHFIKRVSFKLHDTYATPLRNVDRHPFEVTETGWGEFEIQIRVTFPTDSGEKAISFYHHLKLHPWTSIGSNGEPEIPPPEMAAKAGPVHSWQYDEIVFNDPYQSWLNVLTTYPPTPLPKVKKRPVPFHASYPNPGAPAAGTEIHPEGTPEFTQVMIQEEAERLEAARKLVLEEQEKWKNTLVEKELELTRLKGELDAMERAD